MKKFLSRKLLVTLTGIVTSLVVSFGLERETVEPVVQAIAAMVMAYAVAQGWVDGKD